MRVVNLFFWPVALVLWAALSGGAQAEVKEMEITRRTDMVEIRVRYPSLGIETLDADLAMWARNTALSFEQEYMHPDEERPAGKSSLDVTYSVARISENAVSVIFEAASFAGGTHGALDIVVRTYDAGSGLPLSLEDIFGDTETALNLMSTYSYDQLREKLDAAERVEDMLRSGTSPDADNFSAVALRPGGIRIYFQPYQAAPWSAGPQAVDMPLDALVEARPRLAWWGVHNDASAKEF